MDRIQYSHDQVEVPNERLYFYNQALSIWDEEPMLFIHVLDILVEVDAVVAAE